MESSYLSVSRASNGNRQCPASFPKKVFSNEHVLSSGPPPWWKRCIDADRESREHMHEPYTGEDGPAEMLRRILVDRAAPTEARGNALGILLQRRDAAVPELLPELFEDPELGHQAIRHCPLTDAGFAAFPGCQRDPKAVARVRGLLDHARDRI